MELQLAEAHQTSVAVAREFAVTTADGELVRNFAPRIVARASGLLYTPGARPTPSAGRNLQLATKRAMDIVLSLLALIGLMPLLVLVAIAIKLTSRGPVFFAQPRPGMNGTVIPVFKFRSMYTHLQDRVGVAQTVKNDPRVTPVGAFIRKTSIDELPQLLNILLGHMSIVGPRPHPIGMRAAGRDYSELVPYYEERLAMRPGLSGWAQVNGLRGPTDDEGAAIARINHDLAYIQNFSIALDLRIIWNTIRREFLSGSGF